MSISRKWFRQPKTLWRFGISANLPPGLWLDDYASVRGGGGGVVVGF